MSAKQDVAQTVGNEVAKSAPTAMAMVLTFMGLGLQDWMYITAITYAVLQSAYLLWKWVREWRKRATPSGERAG